MENKEKVYIIKKAEGKITDINDTVWEKAEIADVNISNWDIGTIAPNTYAKLLYSDYGIHVQLCTDEKPLIARNNEQNSPVYQDSCMEFFIRPNENDERYLNFEFNPIGTMYLAVRAGRNEAEYPTKDKAYFEVKSYIDAQKWVLQFVIPFEFINSIFGSYTKTMYGNLYKCCEEPEKLHYASFYPIHSKEIDFHKREYFGGFVLE